VPPRWSRRLEKQQRAPLLANDEVETTILRSKRIEEQRRPQDNLVNYELMSHVASVHEPITFAKAQEDKRYVVEMKVEYNSIMKNRTWNLMDCPTKPKVIDTKWV